MIDFIPRGNEVDVVVKRFRAEKNASVLSDAELFFSVYNWSSAGRGSIIFTDVVMTAQATAGHYVGSFNASSLTIGAEYEVVISCVNYVSEWSKVYRCKRRTFGE